MSKRKTPKPRVGTPPIKEAEPRLLPQPDGPRRVVRYSRELADAICWRLANGETLNQICRSDLVNLPSPSTVRLWVLDDVDGFAVRYARARDLLLESWADETVDIADDGSNDWYDKPGRDGETVRVVDHEHITRSKLRIEQRRWLMSKLRPEKYGDRVALTDPDGGFLKIKMIV